MRSEPPVTPPRSKQAFTLVELSITLVIIGLMVGGVLAGQSLIRASELHAAINDIQQYSTAVRAFQGKYNAIPGDMDNATRFWGVRAGTGSDTTCHQTIGSYTGTCNGDGNQRIDYITGDITYGEVFASAQHLAKAGLIAGSYTGASGSTTAVLRQAKINLPAGKMPNSIWVSQYVSTTVNPNLFSNGREGNALVIKSTSDSAVFKPEEMWNIDTKLDDGKPAYGNIIAYKTTSVMPGCVTSDTASTATYALTDSGIKCYLLMYLN